MLIPAYSPSPENNRGTTHAIAPDDLTTIYNIKSLYGINIDGAGQTIAIIGQTAIDLADISTFRAQYGLPARDPQLTLVGPDPGKNATDLPEADLDIEWAGAVAPNANIIYVYSGSVTTSAQYAIDQNLAPVMSMSYGGCELEGTTAFRAVAQQANAQGITWFVSSGDSGAASCDRGGPTPQATKGPTASAPASYPEITAVGGTEYNEGNAPGFWAPVNNAAGGSALSYVPEMVWNDSALSGGLTGGGGAASGLFSKPLWQRGPGVPNDSARDIPDISLGASPARYPVAVYTGGRTAFFGGASVSSPQFAGIAALLNQYLASKNPAFVPGLGNINPQLYRLAQAANDIFHDITVGDNKVPCAQSSPGCSNRLVGFSATTGYDLATGLGSVDAFRLVTEWTTGAATSTTLTATPAGVSVGDSVQLQATVKSSGAPPTGEITFVANDTAIGTATLVASGGAANASISATAALVSAGNGTVSAVYAGDSVYDGSSGSATVTLQVPDAGSLVVPFVTPNPVYEFPTLSSWQ